MVGINFRNKSEVYSYHLAVHHHDLKMDEKKSVGKPSMEGNLIVHGDNLLALKSLIPKYEGRVNCIYIDPPYNTGSNNGWVYNDNVNSKLMKDWLDSTVDIHDQNRHDKWCCMMWPRLTLLRQLLAEDGVIFISIDDNEVHHLRMMMDEIFGEENFVASIIWHKKYAPANDAKYFSDTHDFILCYAKNKITKENLIGWQRNLLPRTEEMNKRYSNPDNDTKGDWKSGDLSAKNYSEKYYYPIINAGKEHYPPQGSSWRTSKENMEKWIAEGRVIFGQDGKGIPRLKRYLSEVQKGIVPTTIWSYEKVGHTDGSRKLLKSIFSEEQLPFDNPKPVNLIKNIITIASNKESIILDSFAGSGTTAQAVLELNKEDGGSRKFILVECEDYADSTTAERVRRAIKGVPSAKDESLKNGLGGEFTYVQLGEAIDFNKIILGEALPSYKALASLLFLQIIGKSLPEIKTDKETWYIGENEKYRVHLIYDSNKKFLQGKESCLKLDLLKKIASKLKKEQQAVIFAAGRYVDFEHLIENNALFFYIPHQINKHIGR